MKTKFKISEIYQLSNELEGNSELNIIGLLNEKLSMKVKYWLTDLLNKINEYKTPAETLKEELIRKYGNDNGNGMVIIPMYINSEELDHEEPNIVNPSFIQFNRDFNDVLNEECELEHYEFILDEFEFVETPSNYKSIFKLVKA